MTTIDQRYSLTENDSILTRDLTTTQATQQVCPASESSFFQILATQEIGQAPKKKKLEMLAMQAIFNTAVITWTFTVCFRIEAIKTVVQQGCSWGTKENVLGT